MPQQPRVEIVYCPQCRWLLRAGWIAQELLSTFSDELGEVALIPGGSGIFDIRLNNELLWSRHEQGGFPEIKVLKQSIRDTIVPHRSLGHIDRS